MFKPTTLLKVVSIIMIIFGAIGLLGTGVSYAVLPSMGDIPGVDMSIITDTLTPLNLAIAVLSGILEIAAGIFGVSGKSLKAATVIMGIYTIMIIGSLIQSMMLIGMSFTYVFNLILPVLFWWGLYQSKE